MFRNLVLWMMTAAAYGAACSTTGTGPANWNDASAWTACSGGVPGAGDTATVTRPLTVTANATVGISPATGGTAAITTSGAGAVKIAGGVRLVLRGNFTYGNPAAVTRVLELEPGAQLQLSAAENPSAQYYIEPSTNGSRANAQLYMVCTQAQPCLVEGDVTGGALPPAFGNSTGGTGPLHLIQASWVTFRNLGSSSVASFRAFAGSVTGEAVMYHFLNCVFDASGRVEITSINSGNSVRFEDSRFINSPAGGHLAFAPDEAIGTGVRSIQRNWFERTMHFSSNSVFSGFLIRHNVLPSGSGFSTVNPAEAPEFIENYIERDGSASNTFRGHLRGNYIINVATTSNPHFIVPGNSTTQQVIEGNVFDALSPNAVEGNCLSNNTAFGALRHQVRMNVVTLSRNPNQSGSCALLSTASQQTATQVDVYGNTMMGGGRLLAALLTGEGGPGQASNYIRIFQNNIWHNASTASTPGGFTDFGGGSPVCLANDNVLDPAGATNNVSANARVYGSDYSCLSTKTNGTVPGYFWPTSGTAPGAGDLANVDSGFVDMRRNVQTYLAWKGVAWVDASTARAYLGADPAARIPELVNYVRQGFAPRNLRLATSGTGGGRIGAVPPIVSFGVLQ